MAGLDMTPEQVVAKIVRWGMRVGAVNAKYGLHFPGGRASNTGSSNNGPRGKKATRWYPGRAFRKAGGKHWNRKRRG